MGIQLHDLGCLVIEWLLDENEKKSDNRETSFYEQRNVCWYVKYVYVRRINIDSGSRTRSWLACSSSRYNRRVILVSEWNKLKKNTVEKKEYRVPVHTDRQSNGDAEGKMKNNEKTTSQITWGRRASWVAFD